MVEVPMSRTDAILKRLSALHPKLIDLSLDRMLPLLAELGNPQDHLPPVIHVAGTNGKGSTIAYLRAFLEAAGKSVHVYNSPASGAFQRAHPPRRQAGRVRAGSTRRSNRSRPVNAGRPITFFEITTATAFLLYCRDAGRLPAARNRHGRHL